MDAILQKVVYFENKSGTGVVFLALCMYLMVIIDNSPLFYLYIFVLEDLAFFPTVAIQNIMISTNRTVTSRKGLQFCKENIFFHSHNALTNFLKMHQGTEYEKNHTLASV